jgi:hypothetical protein
MSRRFAVLFAAVLLSSCASAPPAQMPNWTTIPRAVLDSFCGEAHAQGLGRETPINVVKTTQPVSPAAITALGERSMLALHNSADVSQQLNAALPSLPVEVPADGCPWNPTAKLDARRDADVMVVQITAPFVNPFDRREAGLLLRLSLGGQSGLWFWLPVAQRGERWVAGRLMPLGAQD